MSYANPEYYGLTCGGDIPVTVMDTRCAETLTTNKGTAWDACGINHAYYDPTWGFSGC
jgi:hypothetical protein